MLIISSGPCNDPHVRSEPVPIGVCASDWIRSVLMGAAICGVIGDASVIVGRIERADNDSDEE